MPLLQMEKLMLPKVMLLDALANAATADGKAVTAKPPRIQE
jgi:hypothetical protein